MRLKKDLFEKKIKQTFKLSDSERFGLKSWGYFLFLKADLNLKKPTFKYKFQPLNLTCNLYFQPRKINSSKEKLTIRRGHKSLNFFSWFIFFFMDIINFLGQFKLEKENLKVIARNSSIWNSLDFFRRKFGKIISKDSIQLLYF